MIETTINKEDFTNEIKIILTTTLVTYLLGLKTKIKIENLHQEDIIKLLDSDKDKVYEILSSLLVKKDARPDNNSNPRL